MSEPKSNDARRLAIEAARTCAENRCRDVGVLDLRNLSPVADYFVLATGTSARQMKAVIRRVEERGGEIDEKAVRSEGLERDWWLLLDFVDVVVHVFSPEAREYYDLELLWGDAPRVDWEEGWERPAPPEAGEA